MGFMFKWNILYIGFTLCTIHFEVRNENEFIENFVGSSLGPSNVDSARQNLASSFVNGFVNAGFGQDKILKEDGNKWLHKNKDHGIFPPHFFDCMI